VITWTTFPTILTRRYIYILSPVCWWHFPLFPLQASWYKLVWK
jgi:hypothetical protein